MFPARQQGNQFSKEFWTEKVKNSFFATLKIDGGTLAPETKTTNKIFCNHLIAELREVML